MKIGQIEIPQLRRLAPMVAISNAPFRVISKECGPAGVRGPADRIFLS
jgi:tRNA-dihydrouridine synthase